MKISNIYARYKIPPNLQTHMLRVAAVAWKICDSWTGNGFPSPADEDEKRNIITACLLHDMSNIIKFNLNVFPEFLEPEGSEYWAKVKQEFIDKYGPDEHEANHKIAKEIGVSTRVYDLILAVGFAKSKDGFGHNDYPKKICCYSDQRTAPYGIKSIKERISEGVKRWIKNKNPKDREKIISDNLVYKNYLLGIEDQIFKNCNIKPEELNDGSIAPFMPLVKNFDI